jgi:hypothetical protein
MEESQDLKKLFTFLQGFIYFFLIIEFSVFILHDTSYLFYFSPVIEKLRKIEIYQNVYFSKAFTIVLILMVSVGTKSKKEIEFQPLKHVFIPLFLGILLFFGATFFFFNDTHALLFEQVSVADSLYIFLSFIGAILIQTSFDNISKRIQSNLAKDKYNVENESFQQSTEKLESDKSVNIPIKFYHKKRIQKGWMNIHNVFRGTLLIGTPGSGKSFSIINSFIRQLSAKKYALMVYDFKYPDLANLTYFHYLKNKSLGKIDNYKFHVINYDHIEKSRRINPIKKDYLTSLADCIETAESLVMALKRSDKSSGGSGQFFDQSAINFLAAVFYFFSKFEDGRYCTFPHVLSFIKSDYEKIFSALYSNDELESLLSPFRSAYLNKAFDQLEGQIGTLRINISRLATKETYWVLSGDDFDLQISNPKNPSYLVLANDPATIGINGSINALVVNRITKLVNSKGNLPSALIVDEVPTLYMHKIENLIATARSNKVAVLLGLQDLPQFRQQYGKETADTICSVTANIISGEVHNKETTEWLQNIFGKVKQTSESISIDRNRTSLSIRENMDFLIPTAKISNLKTGELVAHIAQESTEFSGKYEAGNYHCKIDLNMKNIQIENSNFKQMPVYYQFNSVQHKDQILKANYIRINKQVDNIFSTFTNIKQ